MSYILDALRRADAERERGHVPGIHAQPTRMAPTGTSGARPVPSRWLPVGLAVPLVLLLGWLTWRVAGTDASAPAVGSAAAPLPLPVPAQPAAPATSPTVPVPATALPAPSPPAAAQLPAPTSATAATAATERTAARTAPARRSLPTVAAGSRSASAASAPARVLAASAAGSAAPPPRVYALDELPEDVRRELPKLSIGGSIYSESATSRFVIVNGQLCHEGDTLAPGLVLQQIKHKSAVLAFRGYRYVISL